MPVSGSAETAEQEVRALVEPVAAIGGTFAIGEGSARLNTRRLANGLKALSEAMVLLARRVDELEQRLSVPTEEGPGGVAR